MAMLQPAQNKMAYAKVGLYGGAGSGKTYTAALIAIGLHKFAGSTKPVGMFDTEPAASYIIPLFTEAGVPFLVYDESRALVDLMRFMDEAEAECSVIIVDSITHVWRDAQASYLAKINDGLARKNRKPITRLEFHHWQPIKAAWASFTDRFLSSRVHVIVCGRAGNIYEYQKNEETGKQELITTGTRMATEKELGYEPSLLVEMVPVREEGKIVNRALVQKDRADKLNGAELDMPTFDSFKPHFEALNLTGPHFDSLDKRDSRELYDEDGGDDWTREQRQRQIWAEEVQALLVQAHPGQTAADKQAKAALLKGVFDTGSWTKVENLPSAKIKAGFEELKSLLETRAMGASTTPANDPTAAPDAA
jgi:hypothetical protein